CMIRNTDDELYSEIPINGVINVFSHGIHLCNSGYTTHLSCGYIKGFDGILIDKDGILTEKLITINVKTKKPGGGNSGGPLFNYIDLYEVDIAGIYVGYSGYSKTHGLVGAQRIEHILSTARIVLVNSNNSNLGEGSGTKGV
ncbi:12066_t:CDS:1, partial [Racocetra persica]